MACIHAMHGRLREYSKLQPLTTASYSQALREIEHSHTNNVPMQLAHKTVTSWDRNPHIWHTLNIYHDKALKKASITENQRRGIFFVQLKTKHKISTNNYVILLSYCMNTELLAAGAAAAVAAAFCPSQCTLQTARQKVYATRLGTLSISIIPLLH